MSSFILNCLLVRQAIRSCILSNSCNVLYMVSRKQLFDGNPKAYWMQLQLFFKVLASSTATRCDMAAVKIQARVLKFLVCELYKMIHSLYYHLGTYRNFGLLSSATKDTSHFSVLLKYMYTTCLIFLDSFSGLSLVCMH